MADLLPTLSSDEEENAIPVEEDDDDDSAAELDGGFQFGGILGEDGMSSTTVGALDAIGSKVGWSYNTALQKQQQDTNPSNTVPRMDVDALIKAKRRTILQAKKKKEQHKQDSSENEGKKNDSDGDDDDDDDEEEEEDDDDDDKSEGSGSGSGSSSDEDSEEDDDDDDDDEHSHHNLEEDILKTRHGEEKKKDKEDDKENDKENDDDDNEEQGDSDDDDGDEDSVDSDKEEAAKAAAYFEDDTNKAIVRSTQEDKIEVFAQLTLSRPLLRGVAAMGFVTPTPIQASVIPLALAGKDICASAVTGSGKTAAFLLPLMERILHRSGNSIKAVILTPTRELAAQCIGMISTLAQFTKIRSCLIVGGSKNVNAQAAELRTRPDIVIATPGRLLDHVTNTPGVTLDDVEFLILDEADRLLDLGFQDEIMELVKTCPHERQTMLFSATMNTKVDDLIKLSLKRPVRVRVSDKDGSSKASASHAKSIEVAPRLEQEFIRIRAGNEGINREAILLALLTRTFPTQTIVFFDTKATAHRIMIICGLCGIKSAELHGNLTQQQRLQALEAFRTGEVDVLLATDLAARGLDIDRVKTVINFEMPGQIETYVHRIGRTARAGRGGKSCTLIGEGRRQLMKEVIKDAEKGSRKSGKKNGKSEKGIIRSRAIPPSVITHFAAKIQSLENDIEEVMQAEAVAKMDRIAEMEAMRAQNMIEHSDEIKTRPRREWFASTKQKELTREQAAEKAKMIAERVGTGTHRMTRKKRRAREALEALKASRAQDESGDDGDAGASTKSGKKKSGPTSDNDFKIIARSEKRKLEQKEKALYEKSINEQFEEMQEKKKQKKRKASGAHAAGDSSLFAEDRVTHASKRKKSEMDKPENEVAKSSYNFHGYNPGTKLGKRKGHKAFKSKSKYRRRK